MNFNQNRLRFVHCEHLFSNFNEITEYVRSVQYDRASLYAEPMIFKYGDEKNPTPEHAMDKFREWMRPYKIHK
jgi:hypothetical protein